MDRVQFYIVMCILQLIINQSIIQYTVAIQTYIAKLKSTISDLDTEIVQLKLKNDDDADDDDDAHAHYHGHEKCTNDHGHGHNDHDAVEEEEEEAEKGCCDHGGEEGHSHEVSYVSFFWYFGGRV